MVSPESLVNMAMPTSTPSRPMIVSVRTSEPSGSPRMSASSSAILMAPKADQAMTANSQKKRTAANVVVSGSASHELPNRRNKATVTQKRLIEPNQRHSWIATYLMRSCDRIDSLTLSLKNRVSTRVLVSRNGVIEIRD